MSICRLFGAGRPLGLALFFAVGVPVAAADVGGAGAHDRVGIGREVALLDRLPRVAYFVVAGADLAGDLVVDVIALGPLVLEVALAGLGRVGADEPARVLRPGEVEHVA